MSTSSSQNNATNKMNGLPPNPDNLPYYNESIGWYKIGGSDFAGYLHNPYGYNYLSEPHKKAVDYAKNVNSVFTTPEKRLKNLLMHFFGDDQLNRSVGLSNRYIELHSLFHKQLKVINNCTELTGLILWGADGSRPDIIITEYTKQDGDTITLTARSICYTLINEYIKLENLDKLCALP